MKLKLLRKNAILKANGKTLVFIDGVCEIKKITKEIQSLVKNGYIEIVKEEREDGKSTDS